MRNPQEISDKIKQKLTELIRKKKLEYPRSDEETLERLKRDIKIADHAIKSIDAVFSGNIIKHDLETRKEVRRLYEIFNINANLLRYRYNELTRDLDNEIDRYYKEARESLFNLEFQH